MISSCGETLSGRSFMNMTKSDGPRFLSCDTPDVTGDHEDAASSMITRCHLSLLKQFSNHRSHLFICHIINQ